MSVDVSWDKRPWNLKGYISFSNSSTPFVVKPPSWKHWPTDRFIHEFIIIIRMRHESITNLIDKIKTDNPEGELYGPLDIVMENNKEVEMPV